jgi:hypothetical protein
MLSTPTKLQVRHVTKCEDYWLKERSPLNELPSSLNSRIILRGANSL